MNTRVNPQDLALKIAERARDFYRCPYQIGTVATDIRGRIISWGWCHRGASSYRRSIHGEVHCISRANRRRLRGGTIYVGGRRAKTGRIILARPCPECWRAIQRAAISKVIYSSPLGWREEAV